MDNTPGFIFNEDPTSPNSDCTAQNLINLVAKAVIYNLGLTSVKTEHLDSSIAGAGIGGGEGQALRANVDGSTIIISNDALSLAEGQIIGADRIEDGCITLDKLSEELQTKFDTFLTTIYKVGDYFITHNTESPASRFGGTWELCKDRFLIGAGGDYDLLSVGGETEHTLTTSEMPSHTHTTNGMSTTDGGDGYVTTGRFSNSFMNFTLNNAGGGQAHNNMPPYKAVYIWQKISDNDEYVAEDTEE